MTRGPCRSDRATNLPLENPKSAGKAEPGFKLRHIAPGRLEHERPLAGCRLVAVLAPVAAYSGSTGICKVGAGS